MKIIQIFPQTFLAKLRLLLISGIAIGIFVYFLGVPFYWHLQYSAKEGDIIFQSLAGTELADVIEGATKSRYSHSGIVIKKNNLWYVREAFSPVKDTPLLLWIARGNESQFAVFRLKALYQKYISAMIKESEKFLGFPYDVLYELDDEKIYCSELVYKAFKNASGEKLGRLRKLKELNWQPYKEFIIDLAGELPLNRLMITPKDLSEASQLEKVFSNGI
jgi:hypothetical protein